MDTAFLVVNGTWLGVVLLLGVLLCSLLCVAAGFYHGGEVLYRPVIMTVCQIYLVLVALLQVSGAGGAIISQVAGFVTAGFGVAPAFFRKNNFNAARYCIAVGGAVAACAILLF